jgi:hypothetical protein
MDIFTWITLNLPVSIFIHEDYYTLIYRERERERERKRDFVNIYISKLERVLKMERQNDDHFL